jgi:hypothetical protein
MVVLADGMATARRTTPAPAPPTLLQSKLAALTTAAKQAAAPSRQAAPAKVNTAPRVSAPAPPRVSAPAPTRVSSGGGGSVGTQSFSGGAAPVSFAPAAPAAPPPPPQPVMEDLTIPDPLADPTFQKQKAQLAAAKADFDASQGLARSQYDNTMGTSMRQLGWRDGVGFDPNARGTAYGTAFEGNQGDFSGRGLLHSGSYAQANADLGQDFNDRRSGMLNQQKDFRDTQDLTSRNFQGQQKSVEEEALSNAIQAIVAKYSVNNDQVTPGRQNVIQREKLA